MSEHQLREHVSKPVDAQERQSMMIEAGKLPATFTNNFMTIGGPLLTRLVFAETLHPQLPPVARIALMVPNDALQALGNMCIQAHAQNEELAAKQETMN